MFSLWSIAQMQQALVDTYALQQARRERGVAREVEARYGTPPPGWPEDLTESYAQWTARRAGAETPDRQEREVEGRVIEPPALPPPHE